MREILFRGKAEKGWVYGDYANIEGIHFIFNEGCEYHISDGEAIIGMDVVLRSTIGQFTGLKDKNGVKIFEGDIVKLNEKIHEIAWMDKHQNGYWDVGFWGYKGSDTFYAIDSMLSLDIHERGNIEIIGNIHDK